MQTGLGPTPSQNGTQVDQNWVKLIRDGRVVDGKVGQGRRWFGWNSILGIIRSSTKLGGWERAKEQQESFIQWTRGWTGSETAACRLRETAGGKPKENRPCAWLLAKGA